MAKYIEKEVVIKTIDNVVSDLCSEGVPDIVAAVVECIKVDIGIIPATDVQPVDRWISVNDKQPKQDEKVLVLTKDKDIMTMIYKVIPFRWYNPKFGGFDKDYVTHWKPSKDSDTE